jgi:Holliday junction resolvase RusA-like endonuclease
VASLATDIHEPIQVFVPGHPRAQGSKRFFKHGEKVVSVEMAKDLKPWRQAIADRLSDAREGKQLVGAIGVRVVFFFNRPASHYGTGSRAGFVKPSAPRWRDASPDLDKLQRALFDAITMSGLIRDDRYICSVEAQKVYGDPGVLVEVRELG